MTKRIPSFAMVAAVLGLFVILSYVGASARQANGGAVRIDADDIGGVVTGARGPEAGVWVIAETADLPTKFAKIVVTDDRGRYLLPDLPKAKYDVWVRGYGLVDSSKVQAEPGKTLNLTATAAPTPRAAAEYFPAGYWFSLLQAPGKSEFPGTGPKGNGLSEKMASQGEWVRMLKTGSCWTCHQLGSKGTRQIPAALGKFDSASAAWARRIQSGQAGSQMQGPMNEMGAQRTLAVLGDWTDRIAGGEVPPTPPRPQGLERNVVITQWDWADPKAYMHDVVTTDRRNPRLNANGPMFGSTELSTDYVPVLDPRTHTASRVPLEPRDPKTPPTPPQMSAASPYWGDEVIWNSRINIHNPMFDHKGRVWLTMSIRPRNNPPYCKSGHPAAKVFPMEAGTRQLAVYDPATKKLTYVDTCFGTHHVMFAEDVNHTAWTSGQNGGVAGWVNTRLFDETGDAEKAQGWTPFIIDYNGNGKRDAYTEPNQPADSTKDRRLDIPGWYAVSPAVDGSVWGSVLGYPGSVVRLVPGPNPTETALAEIYELPAQLGAFSPRGMDIDRNNVVWAALASGHMASFDRRKCKGVLNGPKATGQHCVEGWTLYPEPLPQLKGVTDGGSAEASYYTWVDQFDTLGLGRNTPINTGNGSEGLLALKDGKWVILRVPYPMGFYTKWMDGRIDDPNGGWKGKGLWATISTRTPFHMEGGRGSTSKVMHFQLRPDPLAK